MLVIWPAMLANTNATVCAAPSSLVTILPVLL
eukprot:SAG31_NODE_6723_length_1910_cov_1.186085_3_plen_31_part_01